MAAKKPDYTSYTAALNGTKKGSLTYMKKGKMINTTRTKLKAEKKAAAAKKKAKAKPKPKNKTPTKKKAKAKPKPKKKTSAKKKADRKKRRSRKSETRDTYQLRKIYFGTKNVPTTARCEYCGRNTTAYQMDHIKSIKSGGKSIKSNLAIACTTCNGSKSSSTIYQWIKRIKQKKKRTSKYRLFKKIKKHNKGKRTNIATKIRKAY